MIQSKLFPNRLGKRVLSEAKELYVRQPPPDADGSIWLYLHEIPSIHIDGTWSFSFEGEPDLSIGGEHDRSRQQTVGSHGCEHENADFG